MEDPAEMLSLDVIAENAGAIATALDALRGEHERVLSKSSESASDQFFHNEKLALVRASLEKLQLGLDEAKVLISLAHHFRNLEGEKEKLHSQVDRLCQENKWLRDELEKTHSALQESEQRVVQLVEEKEHLVFMNSLKQFDKNDENGKGEAELKHIEEKEACNDSAGETILSPSVVAVSGAEVPQRLRTLHDLVLRYTEKGQYNVAVPLCKQALEDLERNSGRYHPDVATMMHILALVYKEQDKLKEASGLLHDALAIREKTLGSEHPAVAATLNNLSVLYGRRGKYREAEPLCKRALSIREKVFGSSHPEVARQLNNLALICQNQQKFDEVELYYHRALEIYQGQLHPDDDRVSKTMNNLVGLYLKQGKYKEAERVYNQVLERKQAQTTDADLSPSSQGSRSQQERTGKASLSSPASEVYSEGTVTGYTPRRPVDEPQVAKTFDVLRASPAADLVSREMSTGTALSEVVSPARSVESLKNEEGETVKRVSSFSRLRGSVGRAFGRVVSTDAGKGKPRRSGSLPRRSSSGEDISAVEHQSPSKRQPPILMDSAMLSRSSGSQIPNESTAPRRGPLRATHRAQDTQAAP